MTTDTSRPMWLDAHETLDLPELAHVSGMNTEELHELIAYGAIAPRDATHAEWRFSAACVIPLRKASRLRRDFDLDLFTMSLLLDFLNRIEALEEHVRTLQAKPA